MLVTTEHELKKIMTKAMQAPAVGIDTEFVWERTFYPQLGLVQLAIEEGLSPHNLYSHLYINGLYWGLYTLHERPDDTSR